MSERLLVATYGDGTKAVFSGRFRVPGGRVTHLAALDQTDGVAAITACDDGLMRWFASDEERRLRLIQPTDSPVTCAKCREAYRRATTEPEEHDDE